MTSHSPRLSLGRYLKEEEIAVRDCELWRLGVLSWIGRNLDAEKTVSWLGNINDRLRSSEERREVEIVLTSTVIAEERNEFDENHECDNSKILELRQSCGLGRTISREIFHLD